MTSGSGRNHVTSTTKPGDARDGNISNARNNPKYLAKEQSAYGDGSGRGVAASAAGVPVKGKLPRKFMTPSLNEPIMRGHPQKLPFVIDHSADEACGN